MKKSSASKFFAAALIAVCAAAGATAQTEDGNAPPTAVKKINSPFSPNPKPRQKSVKTETAESTNAAAPNNAGVETAEIAPVKYEATPADDAEFESRSIASKTLEVVKRAAANAVPPTEIYKVGAGDVLFVALRDAPAKASNYFTVLNDGTIDYPLAGELVSVAGLTVEEIEDQIKSKIKLYENPQVSVKVREHASHAIKVLGAVEKPGDLYLKREAMPLYAIRAEALAQARADSLTIRRAGGEIEQLDLRDAKTDDVLIFPGDILEFKSTSAAGDYAGANRQFYFIGGEIQSAGQKDFYPGMTLTQAVLASGGLKKPTVKRAVIRRQNQAGLLSPLEFDLNSIKGGKQPDPPIKAGDTIEIGN